MGGGRPPSGPGEGWEEVDALLEARLLPADAVLEDVLRASAEAGLPPGLAGPFDFVFIDADKEASADYLAWALRLSRSGTLIVADNVVRGGALAEAGSEDPRVLGVRRLLDAIAAEPRLVATSLQTVGVKGWDGVVLALVS